MPLKELFENSGITSKPKKRGPRVSVTEADEDEHPLLEEDPVNPAEPSADELAELASAETPVETAVVEEAAPLEFVEKPRRSRKQPAAAAEA